MSYIGLTLDVDTTHFNIFKEYNSKCLAHFKIL